MKVDILAVGVHPDDVELSCSGTLLKHISEGKSVAILDLTKGELGTRGDAVTRVKEAENAAKIIGVKSRTFLDLKDGFFENNESSLRLIIEQIRNYKPEIVLCNALNDRHPDHGKAAKLVADACFYSGLSKIITSIDGNKQDCWRPKAVYHYIQDFALHPDFVIEITDFVEKKIEAIMAFKSQFYSPDSNEPETPISSKEFIESVKAKMRVHGRPAGYEFAEGFNCNRIFGVNSLFNLH